jgi:hypothetical protein
MSVDLGVLNLQGANQSRAALAFRLSCLILLRYSASASPSGSDAVLLE